MTDRTIRWNGEAEDRWTAARRSVAFGRSKAWALDSNGTSEGIAGLTTARGQFTILMEYPERLFRTVQMSWAPDEAGEHSPWMRMFRNARGWVG